MTKATFSKYQFMINNLSPGSGGSATIKYLLNDFQNKDLIISKLEIQNKTLHERLNLMTNVIPKMTRRTHVLKCWPIFFDAVESGEKPFEIRKDDRGFQRGDYLVLQRTHPEKIWEVEYTSDGRVRRELHLEIIYVLAGGKFGIEPGHVILAVRPTSREMTTEKGGKL